MKKMKSILVAALALVATSAMAQATHENADGSKEVFKKHAFVTLQGGAQYTLGEAKFGDLLSPNVQVGLGYQFSPAFAARIQANAWQSKGGWSNFRESAGATPLTADYKFNYVAPGVDLMLNLSNLFCGYNPHRVFNLTAFVGGGVNFGSSNDEANEIGAKLRTLDNYNLEYLWDGSQTLPYGRGGVELAFRLSDAVSLLVEGNANVLSDKYNSKKAGNADWYFNALAGLRINLGKTYKKVAAPEPEPEPLPVPAPAPVVVDEKPAPAPAPAPTPIVVEPLRRNVFFELNSTVIRAEEEVKIAEIAEYLAKYPKATVSITGYADVQTGNDKINDRLGEGRADVVTKQLVEKYGVDASRIKKDSKGAHVQPFAENDENRVAVCIAE